MQDEIYLSTDVETDGPIPGPHSMLSFASVAFKPDKTVISSFSANLETLPGAAMHHETAKFWAQEPAAWEACRRDQQHPEAAMRAYTTWLRALPGRPVFVALPVGFDFMWMCWYLMRFTGESPFRHAAIDIQSYVMGARGRPFFESGKSHMPRRWFEDLPHTHVALDDALEQGHLFCNMLAEHRRNQNE